MAVAKFPLLRLPPTVKTNVLKNMHVVDQIVFSLISNASKLLIIPPLSLYKFRCKLHFFGGVSYETSSEFGKFQWSFVEDKPTLLDERLLDYREVWRHVKKRDFTTIQDWIGHLMTVTDQHRIESIRINSIAEENGFDLKSFQDCTKGFQIDSIEVEDFCSTAYERLIIDGIESEEIVLCRNPYSDQQELQKVLMRNYKSLIIYRPDLIGLNEILLLNCHKLWISNTTESTDFPMKTLNQFIKLWRKGSNANMTTMTVLADNADSLYDVILEGIEHLEVTTRDPRRPERDVEFYDGDYDGYDIFGKDGRKATLYISDYFEMQKVEFMVWQD